MTRRTSDHDLWEEVTKSVRPLKRRPQRMVDNSSSPAGDMPAGKTVGAKSSVHATTLATKAPPPIAKFDRRTSRKLTRGTVDIERRIDLHGLGIEVSRIRLLQFLHDAQAEGLRTVLVITGKGDSPYSRHTLHGAEHYHAPERQGRLRRLVPEWLHEAEFRIAVAGFQPAHPRHGGGGAFYVKIRQRRTRS